MTATIFEAGFGIEIECYLPEGTDSHAACRAVASRTGLDCQPESYGHSTPHRWKAVTDASLGGERGIEFVSPILRGSNGLEQIRKVMEALTDFGCTVSKSCGLHVHVGVEGAPLGFFKSLVKAYAAFEPIIDRMMPPSRRANSNTFCRSLTPIIAREIDTADTFETLLTRATPGAVITGRRYFKLNLESYRRHRTVEFRQHSGTLDSRKACNWVQICLSMARAAMQGIEFGSAAAPTVANHAKIGSKAWRIGEMLLRPEGVTAREVMAALNWPSVSLPQQAGICGIPFTTQRTGREVRYFAMRSAAPATAAALEISIDGFARMIGLADDLRTYIHQRTADLGGNVAWST